MLITFAGSGSDATCLTLALQRANARSVHANAKREHALYGRENV